MFGNSMIRRAGALPKEPTAAPPGSEEKIRVMTERASRREQLFHPLDGPGYRGGMPAPPEEPADWPFDLSDDPPELLAADGIEDFDEDEEAIGVLEAPALCSWTEPACPAVLPEIRVENNDSPALPAESSGAPDGPETPSALQPFSDCLPSRPFPR